MQLPRARAVMLSGFVTMIFVAALLLQPEASRAPEPAADLTPGAAAMTATLTPEGLIEVSTRGGSLVLDAELQNALRRDSQGLVETVHPDGSVSVNLQGRFQSAAVARLTEDGTLFICSDADEAVEHALHETPASAWEVQ